MIRLAVIMALAASVLAGCRTHPANVNPYPVPAFLDPVTEEVPNVRTL